MIRDSLESDAGTAVITTPDELGRRLRRPDGSPIGRVCFEPCFHQLLAPRPAAAEHIHSTFFVFDICKWQIVVLCYRKVLLFAAFANKRSGRAIGS